MREKADGSPTKAFFMNMLTRDIELNDAILDLLDNCLDGVVRGKGRGIALNEPDYYAGHWASITIEENRFIIRDNCGGIPKEKAVNYAFRMGRDPRAQSEELPTIGTYGIGMKRAIFKIGSCAVVETLHENDCYRVTVPENWALDDNWYFPLEEIERSSELSEAGTVITVERFNDLTLNYWSDERKIEVFCEELINSIRRSYSFIISKGFSITVNGIKAEPFSINLLIANDKKGLRPYFFQAEVDGVSVRLVVGFHNSPASDEALEDEVEARRKSVDAGWTVICNDRVVLYNDKTHITGWGEAGVPQYHTQFIGIRGIVLFQSDDASKLPMTTTKRGIDPASSIYSFVKNRMREGMKLFTDYTNKWKSRSKEERTISAQATSVAAARLVREKYEIEADSELGVSFNQVKGGYRASPDLPMPANFSTTQRIAFIKEVEEIKRVKEILFGDPEYILSASKVGERCFDETLEGKLSRSLENE